jgi:SPP1 gp7 family putative phage head morphogenesis protein
MATKAEKQAYARKLLQIERRFGRLERDTLKRSIALLRNFRNRVAGEMSQLSDFQQWRIRELQRNLDEMIAQYEGQLRSLGDGAIRGSINLGRAAVVEPLESAGITTLFFRPSPAQINVLLDFTGDLISGLIGDMRKKINTQIRIAALGEVSPFQAMKGITKILGLPPKASDPTKGISYQAERIFRTETGRAYNLATYSQQMDLAEQVPGLQRKWIAAADERTRDTHLAAHGQVVLVTEPFIVGGAKLDYPMDPKAPPEETINCRCTSGTVIPEIGVIPSPLDKKIAAERARRQELEKRKKSK